MLYPVPAPLRSEEDLMRFTHRDLENLSKSGIDRELERVRWRLLFEDDPPAWLEERLRVVTELRNERR